MRPLRAVEQNVSRASKALLDGKLVVLPTETVYGLAADASNPDAVNKIFAAKGRPADNPLIVHLADTESVANWCSSIPDGLDLLAEAFWPGPLTVVLPKHPRVPYEVTGGLESVAIRIPKHVVTLAVLEESGLGLAMPSANPFMGLSPTKSDTISAQIQAHIELILDGGPCRIGIESTVLDLTSRPRILRPGSISDIDIAKVLGMSVETTEVPSGERRSPGQYAKHYATTTPARLVERLAVDDFGLTFAYTQNPNQIIMPTDPANFARKLYSALADMDSRGLSEILIEMPPQGEEWVAIWDRLTKATAVI